MREMLDSGTPLGDPGEEFDAELEVRQALPDRLLFRSVSMKPAVLVLGTHHSGWRSTIDGQAAPVVRADVMFRGVRLPAGRHGVKVEYRPPSVVLVAWALVRRVWRWRAIIPTPMSMTGP